MSIKDIKNANTLDALTRALRATAATFKDDVNAITQRVTTYAVQRLIYETPVDTSQALSNWRVNVKFIITGTLPAYFVGSEGSTKAVSASIALSAAKQQIMRKKYGMSLTISNNLDYIVELNQGKSPQAYADYVDRIVADAQNYADYEIRVLLNGN